MTQGFFLFLLFILPFVINPFGGAFFESPKVILVEVVIEMMFVYFLLRHKLKIQFKLLVPIVILFILSILDLILFSSPTIFFGNQFRLQGTFLLWHLLILALVSSQIEIKIPKILSYLLLPALLLVTFTMGTESNGRAIGTLGEPNALAAVAVFFWPFVWFQAEKIKKYNWIVQILSPLVTLVVIFLSGSRSGFIAFLIQLAFLLIFKLTGNLKIALVVGVILFLSSFSLPFLEHNTGFKFEDRAEVWRVSLAAGWDSPLIGQGFGNIESIFKTTAQKLNSDLQYQYVDSAHNIFLDYFIEGGLLGFGFLVGFIIISLRNFLKFGKIMEIALLLGLLVVVSFNPVSVVTLVAFWWLIGQGFRKF